MAFIIPNATSTASGQKYSAIDQAEPDSLDFEILGNIGNSGVIEGLAVTQASANTVSVSAGKILLNGSSYPVAANSAVTIAATGSSRFAIVVARVTSGVATIAVVYGNEDGLNPLFPASSSTVLSPAGNEVNLSTDVVLASVLRSVGQDLSTGAIVDKRVMLKQTIFNQGTSAPDPSSGTTGELYFSSDQVIGSNSGLYVKSATGWVPLQQNVGSPVPVGAVIGWPSTAPVPTGYLAADGQSVDAANYPQLAAAWGKTGTFSMPNLNGSGGSVLKGTTTALGNAGTAVSGSTDTTILTEANLPSHTHTLGTHTHTLDHTHSMNHGHSGSTGSDSHVHAYVHQTQATYTFQYNTSSTPYLFATSRVDPYYTGDDSHSHSVSINNYTGSTGGPSTTTTSDPSGGTLGSTGSGTSFTNVPKAAYVVWIIKVSSGDSYPAGTSIYDSARKETFAISYEGTLPSGSAADVAGIRLPWDATLTGAKVSLDGVGVAASGADISVDVKLNGSSVFGANKLTIEDGESSSYTAATPPDISTTDLPNDGLLSIDILNASGESGPLNVTLYLSRDN